MDSKSSAPGEQSVRDVTRYSAVSLAQKQSHVASSQWRRSETPLSVLAGEADARCPASMSNEVIRSVKE